MKWVITTDMAHAHTQEGAGRCASPYYTHTHPRPQCLFLEQSMANMEAVLDNSF